MSDDRSDAAVAEALATLGRRTDALRPSDALVTRMLSEARAEAELRATLPSVVWQMGRPALAVAALVVLIAGAFAWSEEQRDALSAGTATFAWIDQ